jgi:hypothetical protein
MPEGTVTYDYGQGAYVSFGYDTAVRVNYVGSASPWYAAYVTYGA